ncbi:MAG: hypothetical protein LH660_10750 [Phormidesmis sp. CAN_BIN36]|nr:hypothetical protein [Phormidesmis sp. CAN_BIN36]
MSKPAVSFAQPNYTWRKPMFKGMETTALRLATLGVLVFTATVSQAKPAAAVYSALSDSTTFGETDLRYIPSALLNEDRKRSLRGLKARSDFDEIIFLFSNAEQRSPVLYELEPLEVSAPPRAPWHNLLRGTYNQNVQRIRQLPSKAKVQEISVTDLALRRLLKERWNVAIELYRLTGLRIEVELLTDGSTSSLDIDELQMGAILVVLAEADLATTKDNKIAAYETCLSIASDWQRNAQARERAGLATRSQVLTATYWRQYCESQQLR